MNVKINWFGLAGGGFTLVVVIASLYVPWWQISIGELAKANVSPVNTNFVFVLGADKPVSFTVPLLWAVTIVGLLFLLTSGIVMLLYSILPSKSYSKHLLVFAYKKPLFTVIFFIIPLIAVPLILQAILKIAIPLNGTSTIAIPAGFLGGGVTVSFLISAGFLWPFYLGIVAAGLCIAARLYHKRIVPPTPSTAPLLEITTAAPQTAPTV